MSSLKIHPSTHPTPGRAKECTRAAREQTSDTGRSRARDITAPSNCGVATPGSVSAPAVYLAVSLYPPSSGAAASVWTVAGPTARHSVNPPPQIVTDNATEKIKSQPPQIRPLCGFQAANGGAPSPAALPRVSRFPSGLLVITDHHRCNAKFSVMHFSSRPYATCTRLP